MSSETPCRVLIIEDTKSEAEPFEKILSEEGYHVEIANNAEDGLARAKPSSALFAISTWYPSSLRIFSNGSASDLVSSMMRTRQGVSELISALYCKPATRLRRWSRVRFECRTS